MTIDISNNFPSITQPKEDEKLERGEDNDAMLNLSDEGETSVSEGVVNGDISKSFFNIE